MRALRIVLVAALIALWSPQIGADRPGPTMTCRGWKSPRIVCEAHYVWPYIPEWTVWKDEERTDVDHGMVVYLTVPEYKFARVEMCPLPDVCVSAWAGWFNSRALFHK